MTKEQSSQLDTPITEIEIATTLKKMKNHKTAGIDGFGAEFYKVFWSKLKKIITQAFQHAYKVGSLSVTLRHSILICLPKKNKPRHFLKNWRPLAMLSVLYKMLSGTLANRLHNVLNLLVSNSQSAFIKDRFIGDNTRLTYDIMHYTEINQIPGLLMSIDFEKAFDSISWNFLYKTLKLLGFGDPFIAWIAIINKNIYGYIIQCGRFSEKFHIERGCRQGDPISPYLFLLASELLFQLIKNNPDIKGINVGGFEIKMAQFADDTTLLLDGSHRSLLKALNTIELFGSLSGLKMNSEKTKVIWLGSKKYSRDKIITPYNLNWGSTDFTLLGINFSVNLEKMFSANLENILIQIKEEIVKWNKRNITPLGKVVLIKSLFLAKINHILSLLPIPSKHFTKELQKIFFKFIWNNNPDKIKRQTMFEPIKRGGLNMPDVNKIMLATKAAWFRRLIKTDNMPWINIFEKIVCDRKYLTIYGIGYLKELQKDCSNPFWLDVIKSYYSISDCISPKTTNNLMDSPLWFNTNIFGANIHYSNWSKSRLLFIKDIVGKDGEILDYQAIKEKANINFIEYHRVKINVVKYIKSFNLDFNSHRPDYPSIPYHILILFKSKKGNSDFINALRDSNTPAITAVKKWHENLNLVINRKTWEAIFKLNYTTVEDNYLIYFNYRILHRILGTKHLMHKMKIFNNDTCRLCQKEPETLLHIFSKCTITTKFWHSIIDWIRKLTKITIMNDDVTLLFGYLYQNNHAKAINTILIVAKNYIFQTARDNSLLFLDIFKRKLLNVYIEQKYLAECNGKLEKFCKAWNIFEVLITDIRNVCN